jgi:hypothetical protein
VPSPGRCRRCAAPPAAHGLVGELDTERLWETGHSALHLDELTDIDGALNSLAEDRLSAPHTAHAVGSGTLLMRTNVGMFQFIHRSIAGEDVAMDGEDGGDVWGKSLRPEPGSGRGGECVDQYAQVQHGVLVDLGAVECLGGWCEDVDESAGPYSGRQLSRCGTQVRCLPVAPGQVFGEVPLLWCGYPCPGLVRLEQRDRVAALATRILRASSRIRRAVSHCRTARSLIARVRSRASRAPTLLSPPADP